MGIDHRLRESQALDITLSYKVPRSRIAYSASPPLACSHLSCTALAHCRTDKLGSRSNTVLQFCFALMHQDMETWIDTRTPSFLASRSCVPSCLPLCDPHRPTQQHHDATAGTKTCYAIKARSAMEGHHIICVHATLIRSSTPWETLLLLSLL